MTEKVPKSDLEELLNQWRENPNIRHHPGTDMATLNMCIEHVEEVLEE